MNTRIDTTKYKKLSDSKIFSGHTEIELENISDFLIIESKPENSFYRFKMPTGSFQYTENGNRKEIITYEKILVLDIASGIFFSIQQETGNEIPEKAIEEFGATFAEILSKKSPKEIFTDDDKKIKEAIHSWLGDMNEIIQPHSLAMRHAVSHVVDYIYGDLNYPEALKSDLERYIEPYITSLQFSAMVENRNQVRDEFKKVEMDKLVDRLSKDQIYLAKKNAKMREDYIHNLLVEDDVRYFTKTVDYPVIRGLVDEKLNKK